MFYLVIFSCCCCLAHQFSFSCFAKGHVHIIDLSTSVKKLWKYFGGEGKKRNKPPSQHESSVFFCPVEVCICFWWSSHEFIVACLNKLVVSCLYGNWKSDVTAFDCALTWQTAFNCYKSSSRCHWPYKLNLPSLNKSLTVVLPFISKLSSSLLQILGKKKHIWRYLIVWFVWRFAHTKISSYSLK